MTAHPAIPEPYPYLARLNPEQREAVETLDGPLLVLAGAGTGKTRVLTTRFAHLLLSGRAHPGEVLAVTFTNKAAREMRERVAALLPGRAGHGLTVSTFHALGLAILRAEGRRLGYKPRFSVLDAADAQALLADILKAPDKPSLRRAAAVISKWKNALVPPQQALDLAGDEAELQAARAYRLYEDTLRAYQAMDFDDLIRLPVELFRQDEEARTTWQGRLRYPVSYTHLTLPTIYSV